MASRVARPLVFTVLLLGAGAARADAQTERDQWQRVPAVFAAMSLAEGSRVADIGAGWGYFTKRLSMAVGPEGRVFAVDISERAIGELRSLVREESLENVEIVHSEPDDPLLQPSSLDAALIVNAYHDMDRHEAMLAGILRALMPGGRLVIVDMAPHEMPEDAPREQQTAQHELNPDLAVQELRRAGFEVIERADVFTARVPRNHAYEQYVQWLLIARRPTAGAR